MKVSLVGFQALRRKMLMKHLKKSLAMLLALVMIFSSMSVAASAAAFGEPDAGDESVTFTVKFFRNENRGKTDSEGNELPAKWVETNTAAPGEYVKARVYLSTNYATHGITSSLVFDSDFFEAIKASDDVSKLETPTSFPQNVSGVTSSATDQKSYVAIAKGGVQQQGRLTSKKTYRPEPADYTPFSFLISEGFISADDFEGKDLIYSNVSFEPSSFPQTVVLTHENDNWYDEFYFTVKNNGATNTIDNIGEAEIPSNLRGTIESYNAGAQTPAVNVQKGEYGGTPYFGLLPMGSSWEVSDENFISNIGWITTTGEVLLDANGGEFADDATTAEIRGIIGDSIESAVNEKEKDVSRAGFKLLGWSKIKTSKGALISEDILKAIDFSKMSDADIAALGWKLNSNNIGFLDKEEFPDAKAGDALTEEMVAALDLKSKDATTLQGYGFNVTTKILESLTVDEPNTKFEHEGYTLYALWDNSGRAEYQVETYLMDVNGNYPAEATQTDSFYAEAGSLVPLQAVAREGFTLDTDKSSESIIVESDPENPSVLKAYYARNQYKLTYKYEDISGSHEETELVYFEQNIPEFDALPTSEFTLTITDGEGNPIAIMPEKMPAHDIEATAYIQIVYLFDAGEGATFSNGERTMRFVYKFGESTIIPEAPTMPGYEFVDWDVDIPSTASGNMSFNAMYNAYGDTDEETYSVTFYNSKGEVIHYEDGLWYGYEYEAVDIPEGYTELVWQLKGGDPVSFPYVITGNTEFEPVSDDANIYNAYFYEDAADTEPYATSATTYGEEIVAPSKEPEKYGHQFLGWSTDPEADAAEELGVMDSTEGKTFYAIFAPNEVTLTFNPGEGVDAIGPITGKFDEEYNKPADPEKPGYTFGGWVDEEGNHIDLPEKLPAESADYTATWNAISYNVIYKNGDILAGEIEKVKTDETVNVRDGLAVQKEGHTFAGWMSSADGKVYNNPADAEAPLVFVMPAGDVTLEAQWTVNKHVVTLDANGGAFENGEDIFAKDEIDFGSDLSAIVPADPEWPTDEKTFKGWADANDATEKIVYAPGELQTVTMPDSSLNLKAIWEDVVTPTYTATFYANGGTFTDKDGKTVDKIEVTFEAGEAIVPPVPVRNDGDYNYTWLPSIPEAMPAKDMDFYAQWEAVLPGDIAYTITPMIEILKADGTTEFIAGAVINKTGEAGKVVEITDNAASTADIRIPYTTLINNNSVVPDAENANNVLKITLAADGDNNLVAYFKLAVRTATFDGMGGTFADDNDATVEGYHGSKVVLPAEDDISKEGFKLIGWVDSEGNEFAPGTEIGLDSDETYKAIWEEITYTITFEEDGGTPIAVDPKLPEGKDYIVPTLSKDGYRFNGWKDAEGNLYKPGEIFTMPAEDVTLTADFTKLYTVTYLDAAGNEYDTSSAAEGESVPALTKANPEKDDYRFGGWNNMPADGKMPASDLVLEPIFNEIFTLSYVYDVEEAGLPELPASVELIAGEETTVKALPSLEGYRFTGWTFDGATYAPGETFTMPESDAELVASWAQIVEYGLTFNENGGSEVEDVSLEAGAEYRLPASTKDGFVLRGWSDGTDTYPAGTVYTMPDWDVELEAKWDREITTAAPTTAPTYTISFEYAGGAPEGATELDSVDVKSGDAYMLPALALEGYTFDYWYDESGVKYPANYMYVVKGDMTFTAKWSKDGEPTTAPTTEPTIPATYTVKFALVDDSIEGVTLPEDMKAQAGSTIKLPALPSKDGYKFDGWYDAKGIRYPAGVEYEVRGDVTLTAQWEEITTIPEPSTEPTTTEAVKYALSFAYGDDAPANAPALPVAKELKAGEAYKLADLGDVEGYEFKGWNTQADGSGASYPANFNFRMPDEATTLYAIYEAIAVEPTAYTLSFNTDGGSAVADKTLLPGAVINLPKTERTGYEFVCWQDEDGNKYEIGDAFTMPEGNAELTAIWEEIVPVDYNLDYAYIGEEIPENAPALPAATKVTEGETVTVASVPTLDGYTFSGWYYNGTIVTTFTMPSADVTLEGVWTKELVDEKIYTVIYTYDGNAPAGATIPTPVNVKAGETVTVEAVPSATGYTFDGWYYDGSIVTSFTMPESNAIVTGHWSINKNDVVLDANGGEFEDGSAQFIKDGVEYGTDLDDILPDAPQKEGYTFNGWVDENGDPIPDTMPDGPIDAVADWKINEYTITFDSNGGSNVPSATYEYNADVTEPAAPTREGFTFKGWEPALPKKMPANNVTVKAIWEAVPGVETFDFVADANGGAFADGSTSVEKELAEGEAIGELPTPTRDGYEFTGWEGIPEDGKMPASDLTVKATWKEVIPEPESHKVNYFLVKGEDGVAEAYTTKTFKEGDALVHPEVEVEGFTFNGWTDKDGNPLPETMGDEDIDAYANLEINSYKVTYLIEAGNVYEEYTDVKFASEVPVPEDPTKEGYLFAGWEPAVVSTMPAKDLTYTAKWVKAPVAGEEFSARYIVDGKTYALYVLEEGDKIPVPAAPTKFGFVFVGWEPEVPATMPGENVEFEAQWEIDKTFVGLVIGGTVVSGVVIGSVIGANAALITGISIVGGIIVIIGAAHFIKHTHTVTFMVDGEVYKVYKVVEGTKIPVPADPAKDGAEFAGWNPEVPDKMGNTDLVFEATWEDVGADVDVVIPDTGSVAGVAAFAVISGAAAAAYVITRRKKED